MSASEEKLEKEVNSTINKIKKSADSLEKNIQAYKKKAIVQKTKLEKSLFKKTMTGSAAKTSKKATAKKVSVKAAPKKSAAAKTTKKAVRKTTKKAAK
ncbi:hypothetical protein D3C87_1815500 [compost metagenome]